MSGGFKHFRKITWGAWTPHVLVVLVLWFGVAQPEENRIFLSANRFFFQFKLQWNDDQHLIANLSIPATMLGSKVGTILLCDIPHPIILKHWVEITPWGAHEKPPDCLNFAVANSFKKGDRCKIHDKEFAAETQLLMCRPRGPELVDLYTMAIYISGPFANVGDKIVQNSMWIFHWQKTAMNHTD